MNFNTIRYRSKFKKPAGTSRGILLQKESLILEIPTGNSFSYGECSFLPYLSVDDPQGTMDYLNSGNLQFPTSLDRIYSTINHNIYPSLTFCLETALLSKENSIDNIFDTKSSNLKDGIPINGLIWMGSVEIMLDQIETKLQSGFKVLKLKIGNLEWKDEMQILKSVRKRYSSIDLEIRVDANGAYSEEECKTILEDLAKLKVHSIEQPIKANQHGAMKRLCESTPVPICLDEELIGYSGSKDELLNYIKPQNIILKPGLLGGFRECDKWIDAAKIYNIGYWITSALETNIGLNAITQYAATKNSDTVQGLGTGSLFTNPINSPLEVVKDRIYYNAEKKWDFSALRV